MSTGENENVGDDLTGIFDHLTPDDFKVTTSAISTLNLSNPRTMDEFIKRGINSVRTAFSLTNGELDPMGILASQTIERTFTPEEDETLGQYIDRLAREARHISAGYAFVALVTLVGTYRSDANLNANSEEAVKAAEDAGTLTQGVYWFAEKRDASGRAARQGYLVITAPGKLGDSIESEARQESKLSRILSGVQTH